MNKRKPLFALILLSATLLASSVRYSYAAAGSLTEVYYGDGRSIICTYDAAGNILKHERVGAPSVVALSLTFAVKPQKQRKPDSSEA